jgi:peptidyl-dipeptidase A
MNRPRGAARRIPNHAVASTPAATVLAAAAVALALALAAVDPPAALAHEDNAEAEARDFLALYSSVMQNLYRVSAEAEWDASTDVTPEHDGARVAANKAYSVFVGDRGVIERVRALRAHTDDLDPITGRQIEKIWLEAAHAPGTIPDVVAARVEAESRARSQLDGFQFCLERKGDSCAAPVNANDIDEILEKSTDLDERLRAWHAAKETGPVLRDDLVELQRLRNQIAREMGYSSYFGLEVADYGMTVPEMMALLDGFTEVTRPLFLELHTWTKHELAAKYKKPVPKMIPAHWLGNRWGQSWPGLVEAANLDTLFAAKTPDWIVKQAESFYTSMGFPALPEVFWAKSDLYAVPRDSTRKKNSHASAWHIDLEHDVRSLMSVTPNDRWFATTHHELGHIYYYISYTRPEVPPILRTGANRAFHEGIGELIALASHQKPYLEEVGVLSEDKAPDQIKWLLDEALSSTIVFLPWSSGVMSHWEHDLYEENLPPDQWNARWWEYVAKFQGIAPPEARGVEWCDAATKTHIIDDPAGYYDYAIATVLKHQLHDHIARKILKADPHAANYYGNKEVGAFLRSILEQGATRDWRVVLREATGEDLSTRAMMEYYKPLMDWLKKENKGRKKGW